MKFYLVICYCCKPKDWKIFQTSEEAISHCENREDWAQEVFEMETALLPKSIYQTKVMRNED